MIAEWKDLAFFKSRHWEKIKTFLAQERKQNKTILPALDDIYNAFKYTPYEHVKIVILGQDPYPNKDHAMGLAFSVPEACHPLPSSLHNIFIELKNDLGIDHPSGSLIGWAKQGVLLLNTSLTVEEGKINSHQNIGWQDLIVDVLDALNKEREHIVFVLWGKHAQNVGQSMNPMLHKTISSSHPSPFSSHSGFFGSKPFSKANTYLKEQGIAEIDWSQ